MPVSKSEKSRKALMGVAAPASVGLALLLVASAWQPAQAASNTGGTTQAQCDNQAVTCGGICDTGFESYDAKTRVRLQNQCRGRCSKMWGQCMTSVSPASNAPPKDTGGTTKGTKVPGLNPPVGTLQRLPPPGPSAPTLKSPGAFQTTPGGPTFKSPGTFK
jgi:hypothetical protein